MNGKDLVFTSTDNDTDDRFEYSFFEINDSFLIYRELYTKDSPFRMIWTDDHYIDFSSILYQNIDSLEIEKNASIVRPNLNAYILKTSGHKKIKKNYTDERDNNTETAKKVKFYFRPDNEENAKRVLKAIMHLAKLSGAKENKQTF